MKPSIRSVKLFCKKGKEVESAYCQKKRRFFSLLQGYDNGRKDVLFKVRVAYYVDGYGPDPKNESCWGNKKYVTDCYKEFTNEELVRSL